MKVLNFGSLNIDHVYNLDHFVRSGETISSDAYYMFCGGKGLNQSIALSFSGAETFHAGKVGKDGEVLIKKLKECGVNTKFVTVDEGVSGHAIIQVTKEGKNSIILNGGANQKITEKEIKIVFDFFTTGDYLLLQNEINNIDIIMKYAKDTGLKIVFNPAPMNPKVFNYPLELVDIFIVNEIEGSDLTEETEPEKILHVMKRKFNNAAIVLTLGPQGIRYVDNSSRYEVPADTTVKVVDTTAAGDTFIGYFIGSISKNLDIKQALETACRASDICVSRHGASTSIPRISELGQ